MTTTITKTCLWLCGDAAPEHKHYSVLVREHGKRLGRLTPDGGTSHNVIYASVFSKVRAEEIAASINAEPPFPGITAKVIGF